MVVEVGAADEEVLLLGVDEDDDAFVGELEEDEDEEVLREEVEDFEVLVAARLWCRIS